MSTCNWLDLQTVGSQPVMPKNFPDHCFPGHIHRWKFPTSLELQSSMSHDPISLPQGGRVPMWVRWGKTSLLLAVGYFFNIWATRSKCLCSELGLTWGWKSSLTTRTLQPLISSTFEVCLDGLVPSMGPWLGTSPAFTTNIWDENV